MPLGAVSHRSIGWPIRRWRVRRVHSTACNLQRTNLAADKIGSYLLSMPMSRTMIERRFGAALAPTARSYRSHMDRRLADLSLSHSMAIAVMVLGRMGDGAPQGALADQLGVEGPSVVPLVDRMERAGLAERRADASDKRVRTLHLTDAGRLLAAQAEERSAEVRRVLLAEFDRDDLETAMRVLERLQQVVTDTGRN